MEAYIVDILISLVVLMIGWNVYLFKTIHALRTDLFNYKLDIANNYVAKRDVEKMLTEIAGRLESMEDRIEKRIDFLLKNGAGHG